MAALVVVFYHVSLLSPTIAAIVLEPGAPLAPVGTPAWLVTRTPLVLLILGQEAVVVFFVLSGLAVALPALRHEFDWIAYYPRRVVRLLVPVAASVALAIVIVLVTPQDPRAAASSWLASASIADLDWRSALFNLDLLFGEPSLNNPLWSLRYELLFSLLLPLYVVVAFAFRRRWVLAGALALAAIGASALFPDVLIRYLPMFLLGTLLAVALPRLVEWARGAQSGPVRNLLWALGLAIALTALSAHWLVMPFSRGAIASGFATVASPAGAMMIVFIAILWKPAAAALQIRPVRWLGRISFSLYLVHVPILVGIASLLPGRPALLIAVIAVPVALIVAELFARFVEIPSHHLSKRVGAWARRVVDAAADRPTPVP